MEGNNKEKIEKYERVGWERGEYEGVRDFYTISSFNKERQRKLQPLESVVPLLVRLI